MPIKTWLEVSLTVDNELAEPVAEVLARFVTEGIAIESTAVEPSPGGAGGHAIGPLRVFAYLPLDDHLEAKRRRLEEALWYLGCIHPLPSPEFQLVQRQDWSETWKENFRPVFVGRRLMIVPAWLEPPPGERIPIRIDPGMAFGTGTHPSTQLCLELIEKIFTPERPERPLAAGTWSLQKDVEAIDIGCGSGILAIAALKLGARRALGVDVDADVLRIARENAEMNNVQDNLELGLGSRAEIQAGAFSLSQAALISANILAPVLVTLLDEGLDKLLTPNGNLVLSGILEEQATAVEAALKKHALRLSERLQQGDWVALWAVHD